ncbi:MAG: GntR family transcriptional regulator [Sedimentisphaerales bacterium]|nr:GntR family transcriptional regulator [Sedimentisphaerales bacterium]
MKLTGLKQDNSLSEKVYQQLFRSLAAGKLHPGQKITESNIAKMMGISRAPVREAFKRLAKERLIVLVPRSGCYIAELSEKEIKEIYEIRMRLECMALEYAFDKLHSSPKPLIQLLKEFTCCMGKTDEGLIRNEVRLDTRLHDLIAVQSGCPNLQEMLENLRTRIEVLRHQTTATGIHAAEALKEHINILQAVKDGNKRPALKYLREHIEHTKNNVLSQF